MTSMQDMIWPLVIGVVVRIAAVYIGIYVDSGVFGQLQYTDIDYSVFTNAARACYSGGSPYDIVTYRYPALIACALFYPQQYLSMNEFGKLLFCLSDIGVMLEIGFILDLTAHRSGDCRNVNDNKNSADAAERSSSNNHSVLTWVWMWCFNLCSINISSRGSFDAISNYLLLLCIRLLYSYSSFSVTGRAFDTIPALTRNLQLTVVAALYAGLVYLRLYPIIYLPTVLVFILRQHGDSNQDRNRSFVKIELTSLQWGASAWFVFVFVASYAALIRSCYSQYGWTCIHQSVLYHFGRSDHRHNFSPHFLEAYLSFDADLSEPTTGRMYYDNIGMGAAVALLPFTGFMCTLASFVPQLVVITLLALRFTETSLAATMLLQTMVFVSMNKVCTAQYFMWYMCLFPLAIPQVNLTRAAQCSWWWFWLRLLPLLWGLSMGLWLLCAYQLEFSWDLLCNLPVPAFLCELNMFSLVWGCSLLFYAVNTVCIATCIVLFFD